MARDILLYADDELLSEYREKLLRVGEWSAVNYLNEIERRANLKQAEAAERQSQEMITLTRDIHDLTVRLTAYTDGIRRLTIAVVLLGAVAVVPAILDVIDRLT